MTNNYNIFIYRLYNYNQLIVSAVDTIAMTMTATDNMGIKSHFYNK